MTIEHPIYVRYQLVNISSNVPTEETFAEFENRLNTRLTSSDRSMWSKIQGASIPRSCQLIPSMQIDEKTSDYFALEQPEIYSMDFFAFEDEPESGTLLYSFWRHQHIDSQDWLRCGSKDGTLLLWSRNRRCFGELYVYETEYQPTVLKSTVSDLFSNIYCNLIECPFIKELSERQANYFFDHATSRRVKDYFHFACERMDDRDFCIYSLLLDLPESKLAEVFHDHREEINAKCTDNGDYPINIAANSGRTDALRLLVALEADMSLGRTKPFVQAIENGDCRFLQTMFRLGYEMNGCDEKVLFETRLSDAQRQYVLS